MSTAAATAGCWCECRHPRDRHDASGCDVAVWLYPGILTDRRTDEAFIREAMGAAMMTLRDAGIVSLFIRLHPLIPVAGIDDLGVTVHHRTVAIDLSLPAEQILG